MGLGLCTVGSWVRILLDFWLCVRVSVCFAVVFISITCPRGPTKCLNIIIISDLILDLNSSRRNIYKIKY
jgi:hypothetical protein